MECGSGAPNYARGENEMNESLSGRELAGTGTVSFGNKLCKLGFSSYRCYLESDHWRALRVAYMAAGLPCRCLACLSPRFQLHHRTYTRLGREQLGDLIPLCGECHTKVHEYERAHRTTIQATHKILRRVFGWTKSETRERFLPFSRPGQSGFAWVDRDLL
jgi:hypothetical protein